jgi:hypothetical protein
LVLVLELLELLILLSLERHWLPVGHKNLLSHLCLALGLLAGWHTLVVDASWHVLLETNLLVVLEHCLLILTLELLTHLLTWNVLEVLHLFRSLGLSLLFKSALETRVATGLELL